MAIPLPLLGKILLLGLLTGCSPTSGDFLKDRLFIPKKNEVHQDIYVHKLLWPTEASQPSLEESKKLSEFLRNLDREKTEIQIEGLHVSKKVFSSNHLCKKAEKIAEYVAQLGFSPTRIGTVSLPVRTKPDGSVDSSEFLIIAQEYRVIPPSCPDWSHGLGNGFSSLPYSNFGCSSEAALAQMVVNPKDLYKGTGTPGLTGPMAHAALTRYREDRVKQPQTLSTTGGGSSGDSSSSGSSNNSGGSSSGSSNSSQGE
jgi:pilus biogenesis lipoprotein CpaD